MNGRDIAWIALIAVWLLLPLLGAGQRLLTGLIRKSYRTVGARKLRYMLMLWSTIEFAAAAAMFGFAVVVGVNVLPGAARDPVVWLAFFEAMAVSGLTAFAGYSGWRLAAKFATYAAAQEDEEASSEAVRTSQIEFERLAALARLPAWICLLLPLLFLAPFFILAFGFLGLLGVVVCVAVAIALRSRRTQLLWVLAVGTEHGFPLADEIQAFARTAWPRTQQRLRMVADRLYSGIPLSEALEEVPGLVPRFAVTAARVGEETGTLPAILREAAERESAVMKRSRTVPSAPWFIAYYWSIASITCLVLLFLLVYIAPKLLAIFDDFGETMPPLTRAVFATLSGSEEVFAVAAPILGIPAAALVLSGIGYTYGWSNLRLPWLTRWFPRFDVPWILRNLASTVEARRPLTLGLALIVETHHRRHISQWLEEIEAKVAAGGDCWEAMHALNLIRARERDVLQAAARSGNLPWALRHIAECVESQQRRLVQWWLEICRVASVLSVALVVGLIAVAFFLPLVELLKGVEAGAR